MKIVVPLAGPDFVRSDGSVKAMLDLGKGPLLRQALTSRPWAQAVDPQDYTFVFHDVAETRAFVRDHLSNWYEDARFVFTSDFTQGAALSALAGLAPILGAQKQPILVDLADILYDSTLDPVALFNSDPGVGGIALTFESDNPAYSYLRKDDQGKVVEAAEKRVISSHASAGTYAFSNGSVLLRAIAHALDHAPEQTYRGLFFVCPLFNGVLSQGLTVLTDPVSNLTDIKIEDLANDIAKSD